ncbi:MAG: LacI family transcriptional regulator, partial [Lentisphaerae bacterium]
MSFSKRETEMTSKKSVISIHKIAELAGVSPGTVSRAFNDRSDISARTKQRILKLAQQYGYQPNRNARQLVKGSTETLGIVVPDLRNPFLAELAAMLEIAAREHNYHAIVAFTHDEDELQEQVLLRMGAGQVDGLIIVPAETQASVEMLNAFSQRLPVISLKALKGLKCDTVMADDDAGARLVLEHLHDLGHRHILYITPESPEWTVALRRNSLRSGLVEYPSMRMISLNLPDQEMDRHHAILREALECHCRQACDISAVIAYDDFMALHIYSILSELKVAVPEQVSLIGFDDAEMVRLAGLELTSVSFDAEQTAQAALDLFIR